MFLWKKDFVEQLQQFGSDLVVCCRFGFVDEFAQASRMSFAQLHRCCQLILAEMSGSKGTWMNEIHV